MIDALAASPVVHALGLALLEFLWQGAAIAAVGATLLFALRRASADSRYLVACAALACMAVAPVVSVVTRVSDPAFTARIRRASVVAASAGSGAPFGQMNDARASVTAAAIDLNEAGAANTDPRSIYRRLPFVVLLWCVGVMVLTAHLLRGWLVVRRLRHAAEALVTGPWPTVVVTLASHLGVRRQVRLIQSARASVPFVVGWLRPVIVVPVSALAGLPPAHMEAILTHELIHVRRGDYLVNLAQCVVEILLFYHPAVWWISRQIRIEREHCCDDLAVAVSIDRRSYAQALASLELLRRRPALAMAADGGDLLVRIRRLMAPGSSLTPTMSGGLAMCAVLTILLLTVGGPLSGMPTGVDQSTDLLPTEPPASQSSQAGTTPGTSPTSAALAIVRPAGVNRGVRATAQVAVPVARAVFSGIVVDAHGLPVPGATVTLSRELGGSRTVPTSVVGEFAMKDLTPGSYQLTVSSPGFKAYRRSVVPVTSPGLAVRVQLEVGAVSETINVRLAGSANSPLSTAPATSETPAERPSEPELPVEVRPDSPAPSGPPRPIRIGGAVAPPKKIKDVRPTYPAELAGAPVQGVVIIDATIGTDGLVRQAKVRRSVPAFDQAALAAVSQWVYTPGLLNGAPTDVTMTVSVVFGE